MHDVPFTGCGPTGLTFCKHNGISKKILSYHRINTPQFVIIPRGKRIARPKRLEFPILVKPLKEEASYGISQASFVSTDEQFNERAPTSTRRPTTTPSPRNTSRAASSTSA